MSNDPSHSDFAKPDSSPFGEVKPASPFSATGNQASGAKAAAAAASVRSSLAAGDFAGAAAASKDEPFGELPEIDEVRKPAAAVTPAPKPIIAPQPVQPPALPTAEPAEIPQLVLKAIFGVSNEMDQSEILRRARLLPQVKSVNLVGVAENEAIQVLRKSLQGLGFGADEPLTLRVGNSDIDFIKEGGVTLAVLTDGGYAAGVRETLIIVARELARLS